MAMKRGAKGNALGHAQYIQRKGRFTAEKYGAVIARGDANFPDWARLNVDVFWKAADRYERLNGSTYREFAVALPRELSREQQIELVKSYAEGEFGTKRPYLWVIHSPVGTDGLERPQARLMFSDRQIDGIYRGRELFFKRANSKAPTTGGAPKFSYGTPAEASILFRAIRERWAIVQNLALERAGVDARVDHRSLAEQGILTREPGVNRGRVVNAIEGRQEWSEVGERKRAQWKGRAERRAAVVDELQALEAEEAAVHANAAREIQEVLSQATEGAD
jgi:hypothetical protein